jgi:iron-sulfur cluster assembly protein
MTLTEAAATKVQELVQKEGAGMPAGLRIRVEDGGCSGLRYELEFDDQAGPFDQESEQCGVRLFVDEASAFYLEGATLDYLEGLKGSGFKIDNPHARSTCGCGDGFWA